MRSRWQSCGNQLIQWESVVARHHKTLCGIQIECSEIVGARSTLRSHTRSLAFVTLKSCFVRICNSQIQNRMSENPTTMERNAPPDWCCFQCVRGRLYGGYIVCASSLRSVFSVRVRTCVCVWWRVDVQTRMLARRLQHRNLNVFRQKIESKSFFVASSTYYNRCCWALMFASCLVLAVFFYSTFAIRCCVVFVIVVNAHTVSTLTQTHMQTNSCELSS